VEGDGMQGKDLSVLLQRKTPLICKTSLIALFNIGTKKGLALKTYIKATILGAFAVVNP